MIDEQATKTHVETAEQEVSDTKAKPPRKAFSARFRPVRRKMVKGAPEDKMIRQGEEETK